jgi:hypothetical protein
MELEKHRTGKIQNFALPRPIGDIHGVIRKRRSGRKGAVAFSACRSFL